MEALRFLKQHNPEYKDVIISEEQAALYHENGIMQPSDGIPTIDPEEHNIPPEAPTANNEESTFEPASTIDLPQRHEDVLESFRSNLQRQGQKRRLEEMTANDEEGEEANLLNALDLAGPGGDVTAEGEGVAPQGQRAAGGQDGTSQGPEEAAGEGQQQQPEEGAEVDWPARSNIAVSEFNHPGLFTKAFPTLFCDGRGDLSNPRPGKKPSLAEYTKHLLRLNGDFAKHPTFVFVMTNMIRRHEAIDRGNIFAKRCADGLTVQELKQALENGDNKVLRKLMYFASPMQGTAQHMRFQADKAVSYVKFLRIDSDDTQGFNFFQTFSAADMHWPDLHRILPNSGEYLNKRTVPNVDLQPLEERAGCINEREDYKLRAQALRNRQDLVDFYFYHRLEAMMEHVFPVLGVKEWIVRYEVQHRGKSGAATNDFKILLLHITSQTLASLVKHLFHLQARYMLTCYSTSETARLTRKWSWPTRGSQKGSSSWPRKGACER